MGEEKDRVMDLCRIYREMDEEGKEKMVSVIEGYLTVQKFQVNKETLLDNPEIKEFRV